MCRCKSHRNPIFCIVPPHVLTAIARNGSPQQRNAALNILATDQTFRALRLSSTAQPRGAQPRATLAVTGQKQRTIYSAGNQEILPGTVVRAEGEPATDDDAINEAYDGLGHTFDFYWEVFGRNSI